VAVTVWTKAPITVSNRSASTRPISRPDGRFRRTPAVHLEDHSEVGGQVGGPLGDHDERARSGRVRADRGGQDHGQAVPDAATPARVDHPCPGSSAVM
jgi:hypothetical protein